MHFLDTAYRTTAYRVEDREWRFTIRVGRKTPLLDRLLSEIEPSNWAYITAWNPRSERRSAIINQQRQKKLLKLLFRSHTVLHGQAIAADGRWTPEPGLLVIGISPARAREIGRRFGQNAILLGVRGGAARLRYLFRR